MNKCCINILLIVLGTVIAVVLLELCLRLNPGYKFDAMVTIYGRTSDDSHWSRDFRPSKLLGYEYIPNCAPGINSFGMRYRECSLKKPQGVFRILLLGDSITENGEWSRYLEKKLNQKGKYEILNAAVSGWGLYQYWAYIKGKAMQFEPDLILIGFCLNDVRSYNVAPTIWADIKNNKSLTYGVRIRESNGVRVNGSNDTELTTKINPYLFKNSYLYRYIMTLVFRKKILSSSFGENNEILRELAEMKDVSRGRIAGIIYPYLKPLREYSSDEILEYGLTRESLDRAKIKYLDLTPNFNAFGKHIIDYRLNTADKIHYNTEANRIKYSIIYPWVCQVINGINGLKK